MSKAAQLRALREARYAEMQRYKQVDSRPVPPNPAELAKEIVDTAGLAYAGLVYRELAKFVSVSAPVSAPVSRSVSGVSAKKANGLARVDSPKDARRAYMREYMRKKRAAKKAAAVRGE